MRLRRLSLIRFGHFSDRILEFPEDRGSFHLIYGPNEAGKSTALRAISALLYGFPERTRDAHLHAARSLRVGAVLENSAGQRIEVVRRKGRKQTLLDPEERALPESTLDPFLGGVGREVFERMFGLDHPRLIEGGAELLAGRGEIGSALFGAAAGLEGVRPLADALAAEAGAIFKPNASNPELNQALRRHQSARARLREASVPPAEWERVTRAQEEARAALDAVRERLSSERQRQQMLIALRDALPDLRARAAILRRREDLGSVVLLASDARERRLEAEHRLASAAERTAQLQDERQRHREACDGLQVPEALLAAERRVHELSDQRAVVRKADRDRRELAGKIEAGESEIERLRSLLPKAPTISELEGRGLDAARQARIRNVAREGEGVRVNVETLEKALTEAARSLEDARAALAALPPERDAGSLRSAVEAARRVVGLETTRAERLAAVDREREATRRELGALPRWSGSLEALAALPVPEDVTLDTFDRRFEALAEAHRDQEDRARRLAEDRMAIEQELSVLPGAGTLPGPEDLRSARAQRDALWREVRRDWLAGEISQKDPGSLAEAYERAVGQADRTGDRLFDEHERVAKRSQLEASAERLRARQAELDRAREALEQQEAECSREWSAQWREAGISPGPPAEMVAWKRRRAELLERLSRIDETKAAAEAESRVLEAHVETCREALRALELPLPRTDLGLSASIEHAAGWIDRLAREQAERDRLVRDVERAQRALAADRRSLDEAVQRLSAWRARWSAALAPLELAADASPAEAEALLDAIARLFERHHQLDAYRDRIRHIDRDASRFAQSVDELARAVCPELPDGPAERRAADLAERLQRGQSAQTQRVALERRIEAIEVELQALARDRQTAGAELAELVGLAEVESGSELFRAEERSAERQQLDRRLAEIEERLRRVGPPLDVLVRQAAEAVESELELEIEELSRRIDGLDRERESRAQALDRCERELARIDGGDAAADASRELEEALATIERLVEEYAQTKLAEMQLREAMRRFSEENQDPILARTSELFRRMTLGRYRGVVSGYSEGDAPVLLCERSSGERVGMEALSDGTRDQLHLGLRLAALDHHAERAEAMPLVVDDVLLTFDDPRARVALELMAELSERYQILFFTHHRHLVELARSAVPASRRVVHELASD